VIPNTDSGGHVNMGWHHPCEHVGHPWTPWIPFVMVECGECSALVIDKPEARTNHETWHKKADT